MTTPLKKKLIPKLEQFPDFIELKKRHLKQEHEKKIDNLKKDKEKQKKVDKLNNQKDEFKFSEWKEIHKEKIKLDKMIEIMEKIDIKEDSNEKNDPYKWRDAFYESGMTDNDLTLYFQKKKIDQELNQIESQIPFFYNNAILDINILRELYKERFL